MLSDSYMRGQEPGQEVGERDTDPRHTGSWHLGKTLNAHSWACSSRGSRLGTEREGDHYKLMVLKVCCTLPHDWCCPAASMHNAPQNGLGFLLFRILA